MVSNVEVIIGYFTPKISLDSDLSGNSDLQKNLCNFNGNFNQNFGSHIEIFNGFHIVSIIENYMLTIYDVSEHACSGDANNTNYKPLKIPALINFELPFIPKINCCLFYDRASSVLNISALSVDGLLFIVDILITGEDSLSLKVINKRNISTEVSNVTSMSQISSSSFLLSNEFGFYEVTTYSSLLSTEASPIFTVKNLRTELQNISDFIIVEKKIADKDSKLIYIIAYSQKDGELILFLILRNEINNETTFSFVCKTSIVQVGANSKNLSLSFIEDENLCILFNNNNLYFYKILNFDEKSKQVITFEFSNYMGFESDDNSQDYFHYLPQIHSGKSEIFFARTAIHNLIPDYFLDFPIYEIHRISLYDKRTDISLRNNCYSSSTLVWSTGFQYLWDDLFSSSNLIKNSIPNNGESLNFEEALRNFISRIIELCPGEILEAALTRYKNYLKYIIDIFNDTERQKELLEELDSVISVNDLAPLILNVSRYSKNMSSGISTEGVDNYLGDFVEITAPLLLTVNYLRLQCNYCIRIIENNGRVLLLSPISISTISTINEENLDFFSIKPFEGHSYLQIPFGLIRNFLYISIVTLKLIMTSNNNKTKRLLVEMCSLPEIDGRLFIALSIILRFSVLLSQKIEKLVEIESKIESHPSENTLIDKSESEYIKKKNFTIAGLVTRKYKISEAKVLISEILEVLIELSSKIKIDNVLNYLEHTFRLNDILDASKVSRKEKNEYQESNLLQRYKNITSTSNMFLALKIGSVAINSLYKFNIWLSSKKTNTIIYSSNLEDISHYFSPEKSNILNTGKYLTSNKKNFLLGAGLDGINENFNNSDKPYPDNLVSRFGDIHRICVFFKSIYKFFGSNFENFKSMQFALNYYSNHVYWDSLINDACTKYIKNDVDNNQFIESVVRFLEEQLINDCFDNNTIIYNYYYCRLIPYRKDTNELSLLIIRKLLENPSLVEKVITLITVEIQDEEINLMAGFSTDNSQVILLIHILFKTFIESTGNNFNNKIYLFLLEKFINFMLPIIPESHNMEHKIFTKLFKRHLIQFIYFSSYDKSTRENLSLLLNRSKTIINSKYDKLLVLTATWVIFYFISNPDSEKDELFLTVSENFFCEELPDFYSLLVKLFWSRSSTYLKFNLDDMFVEFWTKNSIANKISNFLISSWGKKRKYQDIITLALLNAVNNYYDLLSMNKIDLYLFPLEWINFAAKKYVFDCNFEIDILKEIFICISSMNLLQEKKPDCSMHCDNLEIIIWSLDTYLCNTKIFRGDQFLNNQVNLDTSIIVSSDFYGIELPHVESGEHSILSFYSNISLPSFAYISFLKWCFVGFRKLILASSDVYSIGKKFMSIYGNYFIGFKTQLSYYGVHFELGHNLNTRNVEDYAEILNTSILELLYRLSINGYCETAFRIVEFAMRFNKNKDVISVHGKVNKNGFTLSNLLIECYMADFYKTLGFWTLSCCIFLSNSKILYSMLENANNISIERIGIKKKKMNGTQFDSTALDEMVLQSSKIRNIEVSNDFDTSVRVDCDIWHLVLNRLYSSPYYFQGVYLALLINGNIYKAINSYKLINNSSFESTLPSELLQLFNNPENYLLRIGELVGSKKHIFLLLTCIIENIIYLGDAWKALGIISNMISNEKGIRLPIYFLAKIRFIVSSSDCTDKDAVFKKLNSLIDEGILMGAII
ncbi:hypothetical protein HWI79_73 [Cryptosporidium felis]|nr:hypothetical protein HWI79_73 [Cryptosporidium felis]